MPISLFLEGGGAGNQTALYHSMPNRPLFQFQNPSSWTLNHDFFRKRMINDELLASQKIYRANFIHSKGINQLELLKEAAIGINAQGIIEFLSTNEHEVEEFLNSQGNPKVEYLPHSKFIIPGFVDTHCHAPQYVFTGTGTGVPLLEWLDKFTFNYESKFADLKFARDVYSKFVAKMIKNGTTTASIFATIHLEATKELHRICTEAGQRSLVGKVCMNANSPSHYCEASAEASAHDTLQFIQYCKEQTDSLVQPTITPRFAISCDSALMGQLGKLAKEHGVHIQSHINENKDEIAYVKKLFPERSYAEVYDDHGLLNSKTVMAHAVHITDAELKLFKERSTSISHCPTSNLSMFSGLFHVRRALEAGVKVGLGSDVSGGYAPSILQAIRDCLAVASAIQAKPQSVSEQNAGLKFGEAFYLATLGGAEALQMDSTIGNFAVGKSFDALVIDTQSKDSPLDVFAHDTTMTLFEKFIYLGDDRNIERVYIQGKLVKPMNS